MKIQQPKMLKCSGNLYARVSKFRVIDNEAGITEGPLYKSAPETPGVLFMPDLRFLQGITQEPSSMHRMIQPEKAAKPATRSSRRRRD